MSETLAISLISLLGTLLGSLTGCFATSKLMQYRIEQLEKKVDKHNNLIERTYKLEERVSILENTK